jgi:hypothetical protein
VNSIIIQSMARIRLEPGHKVIAAVHFEGFILVFTDHGDVYRIGSDRY